jgi:hypothetical protein
MVFRIKSQFILFAVSVAQSILGKQKKSAILIKSVAPFGCGLVSETTDRESSRRFQRSG